MQSQIPKIFPIASQAELSFTQSGLYSLLKQDFKIGVNETEESIGVNRIAQAVGLSDKFRRSLEEQLTRVLDQYFQQEFFREKNTIKQLAHQQMQYDEDSHSHLLMPPKTSFLESVILKLPPPQYLPPLECLHYTKLAYLQLPAVTRIKRQSWELNWSKAANNKAKKNHEKEMLNITIEFGRMSVQAKQMYVHFLFGEMLKANASKLRTLLEYIRDYLPEVVPYFFTLLINGSLLSGALELYTPENIEHLPQQDQLVQGLFRHLDSRKLLTYFYNQGCH